MGKHSSARTCSFDIMNCQPPVVLQTPPQRPPSIRVQPRYGKRLKINTSFLVQFFVLTLFATGTRTLNCLKNHFWYYSRSTAIYVLTPCSWYAHSESRLSPHTMSSHTWHLLRTPRQLHSCRSSWRLVFVLPFFSTCQAWKTQKYVMCSRGRG